MKVNLYGYRRVDFPNENGERVVGYSCFIGYPDDGVVGNVTVKQWISENVAQACNWVPPKPPAVLLVDYTPSRRVCCVVNEKA